MTCSRCGAALESSALVCPTCHRMVHAEPLKALSERAQEAERASDLTNALTAWREALALLPPGTKQYTQVQAQIVELSERLDGAPGPKSTGARTAGLGAAAMSLAALAWKGKFLVVMALAKGKTLLLGLTKLPALLSMFLTIGVYALALGWPFAIGLVLSIYVHEMGHVAALARYGIPASAPMFVPGLGAFVALEQSPATVVEDATVGLAGPIWGLAAALACAAVWWATGSELAGALARVGAWINVFNLLPVWQLDGGRGWRALDRTQRWLAAAALGVGWLISEDPLLLLLALVGVGRAALESPPAKGHLPTLVTYAALVVALSGLLWAAPKPGPARASAAEPSAVEGADAR